jgi:hypothetical protein
MKALRESEERAVELLGLKSGSTRRAELESDPLVQVCIEGREASVLCPATKLWNTGHGANMMREAVSLMGGYGITEDCPGFLANKWMDSQLEATYEGPEAVQRRQLSVTMTNELFLAQFRVWIAEMRRIASDHPETGACTLATAMMLWLWSLKHSAKGSGPGRRQAVPRAAPGRNLSDGRCAVLAAGLALSDSGRLELKARGADGAAGGEGLEGTAEFFTDLCHTQAARASRRGLAHLRRTGLRLQPASGVGRERMQALLPGRRIGCYEATMPGISAFAIDVLGADGSHPFKAGPCADCAGASEFLRLQNKLTLCLTGSRLAKDRAAETVSKVMIPEALDYPA